MSQSTPKPSSSLPESPPPSTEARIIKAVTPERIAGLEARVAAVEKKQGIVWAMLAALRKALKACGLALFEASEAVSTETASRKYGE